MKRLTFSTRINASRQVVWDTMLRPETYTLWTAPFMEGCYFEGSWEEGSEIHFLAPGGSGMVAVIDQCRPLEFISIKHLGMVKDGVVDTESDEVRSWAPGYENYTFTELGDATEVTVAMDMTPEFEAVLVEPWPKALDILKALCEKEAVG